MVVFVFGGEPDGFGVFFVGGFGSFRALYFDLGVFFQGLGFCTAVFAKADEKDCAAVQFGFERFE